MIKIRSKDQEKPGAPGFPELISSFSQKLESIKRSYIITEKTKKQKKTMTGLSTCSCMK